MAKQRLEYVKGVMGNLESRGKPPKGIVTDDERMKLMNMIYEFASDAQEEEKELLDEYQRTGTKRRFTAVEAARISSICYTIKNRRKRNEQRKESEGLSLRQERPQTS